MKYLKIVEGKIEVKEVESLTFDLIRQEIDGYSTKVYLHHALNNRYIVMYVDEDAMLKGKYLNFIINDEPIAGDAIVVTEKRNGSLLNMSPHEIGGVKMIGNELVSLFPTHFGYNTIRRKDAE